MKIRKKKKWQRNKAWPKTLRNEIFNDRLRKPTCITTTELNVNLKLWFQFNHFKWMLLQFHHIMWCAKMWHKHVHRTHSNPVVVVIVRPIGCVWSHTTNSKSISKFIINIFVPHSCFFADDGESGTKIKNGGNSMTCITLIRWFIEVSLVRLQLFWYCDVHVRHCTRLTQYKWKHTQSKVVVVHSSKPFSFFLWRGKIGQEESVENSESVRISWARKMLNLSIKCRVNWVRGQVDGCENIYASHHGNKLPFLVNVLHMGWCIALPQPHFDVKKKYP